MVLGAEESLEPGARRPWRLDRVGDGDGPNNLLLRLTASSSLTTTDPDDDEQEVGPTPGNVAKVVIGMRPGMRPEGPP
jgi:hypothetical protein